MVASVGVYIHIPFCERICPYCDFAVEAVGRVGHSDGPFADRESAYVDALLAELELRADRFSGHELASLYFGGGTPSLLRPDLLARLRTRVEAAFAVPEAGIEITLEVNPSTLERERLPALHTEAGINRLSVGVQSFDDTFLKALGRAHRAGESRHTLEAARAAGFENLSLDLIFAGLHQTPAMLEYDLDQAVAFGPEHISTYELVMEPRTPFGRAAERGQLPGFGEDEAADMVERIEERLSEGGYQRYELTNYALPGHASRHNRRYWRRQPVLGLGVGAHSLEPTSPECPFGKRTSNPRVRASWQASVTAGIVAVAEEEVLDRTAALGEAMFLGLRCQEGVDRTRFASEFGHPPEHYFAEAIARLTASGWLDDTPSGGLRLTPKGRMLADQVCAEFV